MSALSSITQGHATEDEDAIAEIMRRGGQELRERMARTEERLECVAAEAGVPLAAHALATVRAGGKRLRPLLVMLAADAAGGLSAGEEGERRLVRAAAAVELVHSATLVHDDVVDQAQLRRGRPSVVAEAGRRAAVATGDLLFSRAFAELALNGDPEQLLALSNASSALAAGELLQREDAYAPRVAVERCLHRCELKTAALFEAACRLGALLATGGGDRSPPAPSGALFDVMGAFARRIGLAFQLLDDVLDIAGPAERTGKSRGTDLLDGTVTLPLILARESDEDLATIDLASLDGPDEAAEMCDRIAATGALEEARERALEFVAEAKAMLPDILPDGRAALLDLVADSVVDRYR